MVAHLYRLWWYDKAVITVLIRTMRRQAALVVVVAALLLVLLSGFVCLLYTQSLSRLAAFGLVVLCIVLATSWVLLVGSLYRTLRSLAYQARLHAAQAFDALYQRSPVAYLTVSSRGAIQRANPSAVRLLGETIDTVTNNNFFTYINSESAENNQAVLVGKVRAGVTLSELELPITTTTGELRWVLVNVVASEHPDERLIEMADITEQHAVDTAKSEFVALATHQLRTPIAAIRWNVELLTRTMRDSATDKQAKYLTKVNRNVLRMLNLINDFLSVSKLEMGTYSAEPETVQFDQYLAELLDEFEEKITTKQLTVDRRVSPGSLRVAIDRRLFHIISSNLLSNAVKYTPAGGTVRVHAAAVGETFRYEVADTGIGIPEAEQAELFTKFFRASNAQAQVTEGTGLGLYVVQQSVEILGGTLSLTSAEGVGTTFTIELPGVVR